MSLEKVGAILKDPSAPMKARYRALFTLRNLGAEALGAIGKVEDLPLLNSYSSCDTVELAETCQISADRIRWLDSNSETDISSSNPFHSVDPAPPLPGDLTVAALTAQLLDENLSLFLRYRALFTLRNMRTEEAVLAITLGFRAKSALFRHEIAYVLGQLSHEAAETALTTKLVDLDEHSMVRHECAEALGSLATSSCTGTLEKFLTDKERIVRESCEVALDMVEYEMSNDFQYANTLSKLTS
ncbi:deoxyhypusine hydroxylase-like isoform X2 [Watersipora subatra]|uniref:deoxyhypusine hydroxylase-like isoform X2 n=1 Tax=Watersipora subatra TaxID=2589382 RepID=UPI00355C37C2